MRVVLAPDSFKGSATAIEVVDLLSRGWRRVRPEDDLVRLPLADGGEGTLEVLAAADSRATWRTVPVTGPDGRPGQARWLLLSDGTAAVELAQSSGLPLMRRPDPLHASTVGLGQQLLDAVRHPGVRRVLVALGGSATTDAGAGALQVLGARLLDGSGHEVERGGAALGALCRIDRTGIVPPPPGGVHCLVDVDAPLLGPDGAAAQFAPQKGASPEEVLRLEAALRRFADLAGGDPDAPGAGAAGGTAFGFASVWGADTVAGSPAVAKAAGLAAALADADVVVTGEGRLDAQSFRGKVVGHVVQVAEECGVPQLVVAGSAATAAPASVLGLVELARLARDVNAAITHAEHWLEEAGARIASFADRCGPTCVLDCGKRFPIV
jgi:glycerate kinase